MQRINTRLFGLLSPKCSIFASVNSRTLTRVSGGRNSRQVNQRDNKKEHSSQNIVGASNAASRTVLSPEDEKLVNRGDFNGIKSLSNGGIVVLSPEVAIGKLQEMLNNNQRFNAEYFLVNFLLPLENNDSKLLELLKKSPDVYIPFFIKTCGQVMSDITSENRMHILQRFLKAMNENGLQLSIHSYNSLLEVWLENDHYFDPFEALKDAEIERALVLDVQFFNNLLWGLAVQGLDAAMKKMMLEMSKRGLVSDFKSVLPQIYSAAYCGFEQKCQSLITSAVIKYGKDKEVDCLSTEITGIAAAKNVDRLRILLRANVIESSANSQYNQLHSQKSRFVIDMPHGVVFDIIWLLARNSSHKQEFSSLIEQMLDHVDRKAGFFKRLFREMERHIAHEYFYSATVLIAESGRLKDTLKLQNKSLFRNQIFPKMCHKLIRSRVDEATIWDISNRLTAAFGPESRIFDFLVFSILMFKGYRYDERFDAFAKFVDVIDPDRSRPHLLFPIFACCPDLEAKQKMLFRASLLGYNQINKMDAWAMVNMFVKPILENFEHRRVTDYEKLAQMSKNLDSFGIKPSHTWKLLFEWRKMMNDNEWGFNLPVEQRYFNAWMQNQYKMLFSQKTTDLEETDSKLSHALFKKLLGLEDVERIHAFLVKKGGFPVETNFKEDLDKLLDLYLQNANWGYVKKMLQLLSAVDLGEGNSAEGDFENSEEWAKSSPIKNYHLMQILQRYFLECGKVSSVIEYVYELKRMFPYSVTEHETRFDSAKAYVTLFQNILGSKNSPLTTERVNEAVDLVTLLIKFQMIFLHNNEVLTLAIVEKVLQQLGWDTAVDTWLKFQSSLYCSNGLFALMKSAVLANDKTKIQFLLHRSKNFISPSRANAYLAGAYVTMRQVEKAEVIFQSTDFPLQSSDYLNIFRLLQSQKKHDTALEYSKLCLKYTDLRKNDHGCHLFISYWLYLCKYRGIAQIALDFYELFRSYDIPMALSQMNELDTICSKQKALINKWILKQDTRILHGSTSETADSFLTRYSDFQKDLETIVSGQELRSRKVEVAVNASS